MGRFVKGDIVVTPFPFSDLTASKKRPVFTADSRIVPYKAAALTPQKLQQVTDNIVEIVRS